MIQARESTRIDCCRLSCCGSEFRVVAPDFHPEILRSTRRQFPNTRTFLSRSAAGYTTIRPAIASIIGVWISSVVVAIVKADVWITYRATSVVIANEV